MNNNLGKRIVFIHFLNDFSGSPNVLSIIVKGFIKRGYDVEIITNRTTGFLSNIKNTKYRLLNYKWFKNIYITLIYWIICQIQLFFMILIDKRKDTIYYLNTVTPIGAVWAAKLTRKKYVYHVHENMRQSKSFYNLYRYTYQRCNQKSVFVSYYLEKQALNVKDGVVIYNALDYEFVNIAKHYMCQHLQTSRSIILMVSSLKRFKGVYEFVELAKCFPMYNFVMVLNASNNEVNEFIEDVQAPSNIIVYPVQKNLHPFYQQAKLLLQLSNPSQCVETFGLTILEAMVYGVPAIVPNAGGPIELVENGVNGFVVNPTDLDSLKKCVDIMMTDDEFYNKSATAALKKIKGFYIKSYDR